MNAKVRVPMRRICGARVCGDYPSGGRHRIGCQGLWVFRSQLRNMGEAGSTLD
jgi:hypothetical protein